MTLIPLQETQPEQRLLCARALWLIGVCGTDLPSQHWADAYNSLVNYMSMPDLVLALTALGAILAMTAVVLEEVSAVEQAEEAVMHMQRQIQRMRNLQQQHQQRQQQQQQQQQVQQEEDHPLLGGMDRVEMWGLGGLVRSSTPWQQEQFLQEQEQDLQASFFPPFFLFFFSCCVVVFLCFCYLCLKLFGSRLAMGINITAQHSPPSALQALMFCKLILSFAQKA